jgi:hypothetical protein
MVCASCCALLLRSLRAFADCAFGRALEPIAARWWANVTSRETIERNDSPYGDVLPHWDKDESLQRFELKIGQHCAAPTHGISALLRGPDAHASAALVWLQAAWAIRPPAAEYGDLPNGYCLALHFRAPAYFAHCTSVPQYIFPPTACPLDSCHAVECPPVSR